MADTRSACVAVMTMCWKCRGFTGMRACRILRRQIRHWLWLMGEGNKIQLLNKIYEEQIRIPKKPSVGKQIRSFDFDLDAEYIYASFLQDYGMDLVREQGKLHWKQFVALFQGLTSKTKIKEIMRIRAMDVPEPNGHNQKEIQNIMELKTYYALPVEGGGGQSGLDALFAALEAEAMR